MCHPTAVTPPPAHPFLTFAISDAQVPAGQAHHGGLLGALVSCVLLKAAGGSWGQARQLPAPRQVPALWMETVEIPGFDIAKYQGK